MPQQIPINELTLVIARIEDLLLTEEKVGRAVQLLAEGIRDAFPGSSGAGVSLLDGQGHRTSTGSTDPLVRRADESTVPARPRALPDRLGNRTSRPGAGRLK